MTVESFTYITSLNNANPNGATDPKKEGDDHIRGVKTTLLNSFPNINAAVTKTSAEINDLAKNITEREYVILKEDLKTRKKKIFKLHLINFIKIYNTRNLIFPPKQTQSKLSPLSQLQPEFKKILELTKDLTNKNNSKLYFVYLPEYTRFKTNYDNKNYNLVKEIVNELNIPFIDIYKDVFEKEKNPLKLFPFELDNHYNQEGYKKVGEKIYKFTND